MSTELIKSETLKPELYQTGLTEILEEIAVKCRSRVLDSETVNGRAEIKSLAYTIARSKTLIDEIGAEIVGDWKKKAKVIDEKRKESRDFLDALKDEIRKPLTDWETAEKERAEYIQANLHHLSNIGSMVADQGISELEAALEEIESTEITEDDYGEFMDQARREKEKAKLILDSLLTKKISDVKAAEKAERERLEAEEAARIARDEAIRKEEKEKAQKAAQAERDQAKFEAEQAEEAEKRRQNDRNHRAKIHREILACLTEEHKILDSDSARQLITLMAQGKIPHVSIQY